jgi:uncharacterized membrane protein
MIAIATYDVVVALHIIAVLAAYGLPLAYPLLLPWLRGHHPRAMPGVHAVQRRLQFLLSGPGTALVLAFGVYLAADAEVMDEPWVHVGMGAILIIALAGGWLLGATRRMAELSAADVERAGPTGPVDWSNEYEQVYRRYMLVEVLLGLLVAVTVFAMATKIGA